MSQTAGETAYEAYRYHQNGVSYNGGKIPRWAEVRPDIKSAWEAAANRVIASYEARRKAVAEERRDA